MSFEEIDKLVALSGQPLSEEWLEKMHGRIHSSERRDYYRFLYHLAHVLRPRLCLEIGTEFGFGSAHMAAACANFGGQVVGVDTEHPSSGEIEARSGNYWHILGDSTGKQVRQSVRDLVNRFGLLGLVFQDSSHHYEASCQEFEYYSSLCAMGAVWVCDDVTPAFYDPSVDPPGKGMMQYWTGIARPKKLYKDVLHFPYTMGVALL